MTNELVQKGETRLEVLLETEKVKEKFERLLKDNAAAFVSSLISVYRGNDALQKCEPMSVIAAASVAATLDLPINPNLGMAYVVPYGGVAGFQLGWKGLVQLAQRTGLYEAMNATPIYEGQLLDEDPFTGDYSFGKEKTSDVVIGYLFYFRLLSGFRKYTYWSVEKVEKHAKRYSQTYAKGYGNWKTNFEPMALKTVVIDGLNKWGPKSIKMQTVAKAISSDSGVIDLETGEVKSFPDAVEPEAPMAPQETSSRLKQAINAEEAPKTEEKPMDSAANDYKLALNDCTTIGQVNKVLNEAETKVDKDIMALLNVHATVVMRRFKA